jgi:hypothetical protein
MTYERHPDRLAGTDMPKAGGLVGRCSDKELAVGAERRAVHRVLMAYENVPLAQRPPRALELQFRLRHIDPIGIVGATRQSFQRQGQSGSDIAAHLMLAGEISEEPQLVAPHAREFRLHACSPDFPALRRPAAATLLFRQRHDPIRDAQSHPGEASDHRHQHRRCTDCPSKLRSFHSVTSWRATRRLADR